ncbi:hypothetical protein ABLT15_37300, partial [Paraburkholderia tropica]|uniref:hypothetical protein n=1 Tax=Paraburkholderia tropica TaxID=92647 RepID=UPI002AB77947
ARRRRERALLGDLREHRQSFEIRQLRHFPSSFHFCNVGLQSILFRKDRPVDILLTSQHATPNPNIH